VIIAIDPGTHQSAYVYFDDFQIILSGIIANSEMEQRLKINSGRAACLVCEMVASYGKPVGREVFETCVWIGRFIASFNGPHTLIERPDVKMHLCYSRSKVTDGVIRQRLIDIYGGKDKAIGKKKTPGPLYGIRADEWQALALAITYWETKAQTETAVR
jgi:hypothetical protein